MFVLFDETHSERQTGDYASFDEALAEVRRRATIPWDQAPNRAPCGSWGTCGRQYLIIDYDPIGDRERSRVTVMSIDARGVVWHARGPENASVGDGWSTADSP